MKSGDRNNKKKQLDILKQTYVDVAKKKINKQKNIFNPVIDTEKVIIMINKVDKNVQTLIHNTLKSKLESKCNRHGLIKEDSIQIINISSASVKGNVAEFYVTYQGLACNPVEGMIVEANIVNITKAGIRAELVNFNKSPIIYDLQKLERTGIYVCDDNFEIIKHKRFIYRLTFVIYKSKKILNYKIIKNLIKF